MYIFLFFFCFFFAKPNSKWWFHALVVCWIFGCTVTQWTTQKHSCVHLLYLVTFFPQEPLKLSAAGNNYLFPRERTNIQGIRRHLACKSLFPSPTHCITFIFLFSFCFLFCLPNVQAVNLIVSHVLISPPTPPTYPSLFTPQPILLKSDLFFYFFFYLCSSLFSCHQ